MHAHIWNKESEINIKTSITNTKSKCERHTWILKENMLTFVFTCSAIVHKRSGVFEENQGLNQRRRRSPVHLNWLFTQTLSSFSAAILKGHRVLGTMGQCMLGYIGSGETTLQWPWPSHASVPLVARVSCQLSGNRSHCHLFWFFQFEITKACYFITYIQIECWGLTSFESICEACATFTLLKLHSKLTIKVIINKCFVNI